MTEIANAKRAKLPTWAWVGWGMFALMTAVAMGSFDGDKASGDEWKTLAWMGAGLAVGVAGVIVMLVRRGRD